MRANRWIVLIVFALLISGCVPAPTAPAAPPPVEALLVATIAPIVAPGPTATPTATAEPTVAPTSTSVPPIQSAPLTVEEILEGNAAAQATLKTFQGMTEMEVEAAGQTMSMISQTMMEPPDKEYALTEILGQQIETVTLDGAESFFTRQAGADVWIKMDAEQAGVMLPTKMQINEFALSPQLEGEEAVDGVDSYVIAYDIDMARFFEADPRMATFFDPLATTGSGKAWIGKEDLLIRKMEVEMAMKGAELDLTMLMEATVGGFNEPIAIPQPFPYVEMIARPVGDTVFAVAFSPDGEILAACDDDMLIYLWDMADLAADPVLLDHPDVVKQEKEGGTPVFTSDFYTLAFSPDGKTLAAGSRGFVYLYDLTDLEADPVALPVQGANYVVDAVAYSSDGATLAAGGGFHGIYLWPTDDLGAAPTVLDVQASGGGDLLFTPDGKSLIYSGSGKETVLMWPLADLTTEPEILAGNKGLIRSIDVAPNSLSLYAVGFEDPVWVWSLDQLGAAPEMLIPSQYKEIGKGPTLSLALSPNGQLLATGDVPGTVRLWLLANLEFPLIAWPGHGEYEVLSVAFSPDGEYLASGGGDAQVIVWALHLEE
jgi:WD40 repeat protein